MKQNSNAGSKKNGRKTLGQTGLNPFVAEKVGRAWWLFARPAVFPFPVPLFYFTKKKECEFFQRLFNAAVADFSASSTATIERYLRSPRRRGSR